MGNCAVCGEGFEQTGRGRPRKFCSPKCKDISHNAKLSEARRTVRSGRTCEGCGTPISDDRPGQARYCTQKCQWDTNNKRAVARKREPLLAARQPCEECGGTISDDKKTNAKFCSRECMTLSVRRRNYDSAAARAYNLNYKYGMAAEEFDAMLATQGGKCAICKTDELGKKGWHVDHDHASGRIRGILCSPCNTGLGHLRDRIDLLEAAIMYLKESG